MDGSTVTAKGQTTVPAQVRRKAGATPGARLSWHVMPDGRIVIRVKKRSILDLAGTLKAPKGRRVSIDDMNAWR